MSSSSEGGVGGGERVVHVTVVVARPAPTRWWIIQPSRTSVETRHLEALEGVDSSLRLFQMDLLDYESAVATVRGCTGLFHLASPCIVDQVRDPEKELLDPAIKGTINVSTAAKKVGIRRVVLTS